MQIKDVIQKTTQFFRDKGFESPRLDTELLIAEALRWERMKLYLNYDYPLSENELSVCRELVRRRATGEPVAYILGRKDFYNHTFRVTPEVLIPRPETETIVETVVQWHQMHGGDLNLIDFGSGSGCIGLSILAECPEAKLLGVDVSAGAIEVARMNANNLGLQERSQFLVSDVSDLRREQVAAFLNAPVDIVVANPPYIATDDPHLTEGVRRFEPSLALFSSDNGSAHIRSWSMKAAEFLKPGGMAMFEIGFQQGQLAREIFESCEKFENIEVIRDLAGQDRFIRAFKREETANG